MDKLAKLFSSASLVKIMRLFMFHPEEAFDTADIADQAKVTRKSASYELKLLKDIGFVKPRTFSRTVTTGRGKAQKTH